MLATYKPQEEAERCFRLARGAFNERLIVELENLGWAYLIEGIEVGVSDPEGRIQTH